MNQPVGTFSVPPIRCGAAENMVYAAVKQAETHAALIHQSQGHSGVSDGEARWMRGRRNTWISISRRLTTCLAGWLEP